MQEKCEKVFHKIKKINMKKSLRGNEIIITFTSVIN